MKRTQEFHFPMLCKLSAHTGDGNQSIYTQYRDLQGVATGKNSFVCGWKGRLIKESVYNLGKHTLCKVWIQISKLTCQTPLDSTFKIVYTQF